MCRIYICICGFAASIRKCVCCSLLGQDKTLFHLLRKAVSWKPSDWCIRQPTEPYFEAYWPSDSAVFRSQRWFAWWQSLCTERWKMTFWFSEQNLIPAMRMHLANVFPSVCLRWNEACSRGLHPNNWVYKVPRRTAPLKTRLWPNIYDPINAEQ